MEKVLFLIISCLFSGAYCVLSNSLAIASTGSFMVSILTRPDNPNTYSDSWDLACGGVIIGKFTVLTTGSCVHKVEPVFLGKEDLIIRANTEFWNCDCGRSKDHTVASMKLHPRYRNRLCREKRHITVYDYNVGIITVGEEFNGFYETISPMYVSKDMVNMFVVFGWGQYMAGYENNSQQLRHGHVFLEDTEKCEEIFEGCFANHTFCQTFRTGMAPCKGDEGGPLMGVPMFDAKAAYPYYGVDIIYWDRLELGIIGLVDETPTCGGLYPARYTYIRPYIQWITKEMNRSRNPDTWE